MILRLTMLLLLRAFTAETDASSTDKGRGCFYDGQYRHGTWMDGCDFNCTCHNPVSGHYKCTLRCPVYRTLPPGCVLQLPPGEECCREPDCSYITDQYNSKQRNANEEQSVPNDKPSEKIGQYNGCLFKGKYRQGSWNDGCARTCTCDNAAKGLYTCRKRCVTYTDVPAGCHLELPSGEKCCKEMICNGQHPVAKSVLDKLGTAAESQDQLSVFDKTVSSIISAFPTSLIQQIQTDSSAGGTLGTGNGAVLRQLAGAPDVSSPDFNPNVQYNLKTNSDKSVVNPLQSDRNSFMADFFTKYGPLSLFTANKTNTANNKQGSVVKEQSSNVQNRNPASNFDQEMILSEYVYNTVKTKRKRTPSREAVSSELGIDGYPMDTHSNADLYTDLSTRDHCIHEHKQYSIGSTWDVWVDGCQMTCVCEHTATYVCEDRCPTFRRLPLGCTLRTNPSNHCCKIPDCRYSNLSERARSQAPWILSKFRETSPLERLLKESFNNRVRARFRKVGKRRRGHANSDAKNDRTDNTFGSNPYNQPDVHFAATGASDVHFAATSGQPESSSSTSFSDINFEGLTAPSVPASLSSKFPDIHFAASGLLEHEIPTSGPTGADFAPHGLASGLQDVHFATSGEQIAKRIKNKFNTAHTSNAQALRDGTYFKPFKDSNPAIDMSVRENLVRLQQLAGFPNIGLSETSADSVKITRTGKYAVQPAALGKLVSFTVNSPNGIGKLNTRVGNKQDNGKGMALSKKKATGRNSNTDIGGIGPRLLNNYNGDVLESIRVPASVESVVTKSTLNTPSSSNTGGHGAGIGIENVYSAVGAVGAGQIQAPNGQGIGNIYSSLGAVGTGNTLQASNGHVVGNVYSSLTAMDSGKVPTPREYTLQPAISKRILRNGKVVNDTDKSHWCKNSTTKATKPSRKTSKEKCSHKGTYYSEGERWSDGCKFICRCDPIAKVTCTYRCYNYTTIPSGCSLVKPHGEECCSILVCASNVRRPGQMPPPLKVNTQRELSQAVDQPKDYFNQWRKLVLGLSGARFANITAAMMAQARLGLGAWQKKQQTKPIMTQSTRMGTLQQQTFTTDPVMTQPTRMGTLQQQTFTTDPVMTLPTGPKGRSKTRGSLLDDLITVTKDPMPTVMTTIRPGVVPSGVTSSAEHVLVTQAPLRRIIIARKRTRRGHMPSSNLLGIRMDYVAEQRLGKPNNTVLLAQNENIDPLGLIVRLPGVKANVKVNRTTNYRKIGQVAKYGVTPSTMQTLPTFLGAKKSKAMDNPKYRPVTVGRLLPPRNMNSSFNAASYVANHLAVDKPVPLDKNHLALEALATTDTTREHMGCNVNGTLYQQGQSWKVGCRQKCSCVDPINQQVSCRLLCARWKLPAACVLQAPAVGKCCHTPVCPAGYQINYPPGFGPE